MLTTMKSTTLTVPRRRLESGRQSPVTCAEAAEILRRANRLLNPKDREEIASGIEEARRRMKNEHLLLGRGDGRHNLAEDFSPMAGRTAG